MPQRTRAAHTGAGYLSRYRGGSGTAVQRMTVEGSRDPDGDESSELIRETAPDAS